MIHLLMQSQKHNISYRYVDQQYIYESTTQQLPDITSTNTTVFLLILISSHLHDSLILMKILHDVFVQKVATKYVALVICMTLFAVYS